MSLRLELNTNPRSVAHAVELARAAEAAGYYRFGCWDSPALHVDCWPMLMAVAMSTSRIKLGPNVTNPVTRHPVVTASAALAVEQVAPGRTYIGIGTGDSGVYNLGMKAASQRHLGTYIRAVRELMDDGATVFDAQSLSLAPRPTSRIPIYMSAHGPRGVAMAAEHCDGIIAGTGFDADVVASLRERVSAVRSDVTREPAEPDIWWVATAVLATGDSRRLRETEWYVGVPAHHLTRFGLKDDFVPQDLAEGVAAIGEAYVVATHGQPTETELRRYHSVLDVHRRAADYLSHRFLVLGSYEDVVQRFRALYKRGVRQIAVSSGPLVSEAEIFDIARAAVEASS